MVKFLPFRFSLFFLVFYSQPMFVQLASRVGTFFYVIFGDEIAEMMSLFHYHNAPTFLFEYSWHFKNFSIALLKDENFFIIYEFIMNLEWIWTLESQVFLSQRRKTMLSTPIILIWQPLLTSYYIMHILHRNHWIIQKHVWTSIRTKQICPIRNLYLSLSIYVYCWFPIIF